MNAASGWLGLFLTIRCISSVHGGQIHKSGLRPYCRSLRLRFPCSRWQVQGSPSVASPFSGTIHALRSPCFAVAPAQAVPGLGVPAGEGPPDLHLITASPTRPLSFIRFTPARPSTGQHDVKATDRTRIVLTCMDALMPRAQGRGGAASILLHFHHPWWSEGGRLQGCRR